ncbi:MAG: cyclopropane-fatty-acyl-phospholipid synthase family protein [Planctomycetota bacterium]
MLTKVALELVERGWVPDTLTRAGIRSICKERLDEENAGTCEERQQRKRDYMSLAAQSELAPLPEKANEQHYEVPPAFFELALGPRLKYSSCYWPDGVVDLAGAEREALRITCERAQIEDGMEILELGCGWGSLTLWMAEHFPQCRITAISNSSLQIGFIERRLEALGNTNVRVITQDMNVFDIDQSFDRVVSVEMFEHMRNHELLLQKISNWLRPGGKLFAHFFCHREFAYPYEPKDESDWMARHFFSGGMMPSDDWLLQWQRDLKVVEHHRWSGTHYEKTANAWLENVDREREKALAIFAETYGDDTAKRWLERWRVFFMSCAELFGYRNGEEWWVAHYVLEKS